MHPRIALIGASGYTGVELTRLLVPHPDVELVVVGSDRWVGASIAEKVGAPSGVRYSTLDSAVAQAASCDIVMLATPADASLSLVPVLLEAGRRVIDLSGAFRLKDPTLYPRFYNFEHPYPELLVKAVYGLPELRRDQIPKARLVANPGCYATAIQLALAPILMMRPADDPERAAIRSARFIVDAMSGVTGAGRKASEEYSFAEIAGNLRTYRALRHQHAPEIEQGLNELLGKHDEPVGVTFVPHLLPVQRGILATCHVITDDMKWEGVQVFDRCYEGETFVEVTRSADDVALHHVVGTNKCRIGWSYSERNELVITSAIDNLMKGAAGQAVQNLNLMLGLDERTALVGLRSFLP